MVKTTLGIDGMMCSMCEVHVGEAIRKSVPVKKVQANHKNGTAVLLSEESLDATLLREAVEKTGYTVTSVEEAPYVRKGLFGLGK